MTTAFGDSVTASFPGNSVPFEQMYITRLSAELHSPITVRAVSGAQAADQSFVATQCAAGDNATILIGANDARLYGMPRIGYYEAFLRNLIVSMAAPNKIIARNMSLTGAWSNTMVNSIGKNTTSPGAKASAQVSGTSVYVSYIVQDNAAAGGIATIKIDGSVVGSINSTGTNMTTQNGLSYAPACARFSGLSDGAHAVEVEVTSAGKIFYLDYIAGSDQPLKPNVYVGNVLRQRLAGLGTDTTVSAYNGVVDKIVTELRQDGLGITLVDVSSKLDPVADLLDGIHPNVTGQNKLFTEFRAAMSGGLVYIPAQVSRADPFDGRYFIGTGAEMRELLTR